MEKSDKVTVLYVDDEPINLYLFERVLKRINYNVITANSGYEGLEKLQDGENINVVVTDMKMPGMNGVEFIREAKPICPDTLFFLLTGFDMTPEIEEAIEEKLIIKYMQKPFDQFEIDTSIKSALKASNNTNQSSL